MESVSPRLEAARRLTERFGSVMEQAGLPGDLTPAQQHERETRIALGGERLRAVEQREGLAGVEADCELGGSEVVVDRALGAGQGGGESEVVGELVQDS